MDAYLNKTARYFRQIQEQYGDLIFLNSEWEFKPVPDNPELKPAQSQDVIQVETEQNMDSTKDMFTGNNEWQKSESVKDLEQMINTCKKCPLGETRTNFVFGTGNPDADIMIIGEAPGHEEDMQGKPFVGRAGQLLTKILEAIDLSRHEVFIANILKCRPPNNRRPEKSEIEECEPYLKKQIELIKPQFILSLGLTAIQALSKKKHRMGDIRGSLMEYHGIKMLVTYHPAALLRNPNWKKDTWKDVKYLRKLYDEYLENK